MGHTFWQMLETYYAMNNDFLKNFIPCADGTYAHPSRIKYVSHKCKECHWNLVFIRDRNFPDGSGKVLMCENPSCKDFQLYVYPDNPHRKVPHTKSQHHQKAALGGTDEGEAQGMGCTTLRFVLYRVRPIDPDNAAGSTKDLIDGLRHAGLIHDDSPEHIILQTEQVRVKSFKEERTEITISQPSPVEMHKHNQT